MKTMIPNKFSQSSTILPSQCDSLARLSPQAAFRMFQDVANQHATIMGIGGPDMLKNDKAFWVVTRTKVIFNKLPLENDEVTISTWPAPAVGLRCDRSYSIASEDETLVAALSEWVIIDAITRRLRKVDTVNYPNDLQWITEKAIDTPFSKFKDEFTAQDFVYERVIRSTDIDLTHHTNNAIYCSLLMDSFSVKELEEMTIKEMEIFYQNESREGETLQIFRQKKDEAYYFAIKKNDGTIITLAIITL